MEKINKFLKKNLLFLLIPTILLIGWGVDSCNSTRNQKALIKQIESDRVESEKKLNKTKKSFKQQNKLEKEKTYNAIKIIEKMKFEGASVNIKHSKVILKTKKELKKIRHNANLLYIELGECHKKIDLQNLSLKKAYGYIDKKGKKHIGIIDKQGFLLKRMIGIKIFNNMVYERDEYKRLYKKTAKTLDIVKKIKIKQKKIAYGPGIGGSFYPKVALTIGVYLIWNLNN